MALLAGKAGIVTGAAQGFGLATSERLAEQGARVLMVDVNALVLAEAAATLRARGLEVRTHAADVADEAQVEGMIAAGKAGFGRIDFLHQNAAVQVEKTLLDTTVADWDRLMAVNVRSMFLGARAVISGMLAQGGGAIVNSASVLALSADEMLAAYTASKHAVLGLTRAIAATGSFARGGVRCNCICPGDIRTPMVARYFAALPDPEAAEAATAAHYPIGRIAEPQEMADVVAFLVSDLSRFVNGAALVADGGMMARVY